MPGVAGKIAFITGAGSGIGRATARVLAQGGADVALCDINLAAAEEVAREIGTTGRRAIVLRVDVTRLDEVTSAVEKTQRDLGRVDILLSNAGIAEQAPLIEITEEQWDRMFNVHLTGAYNCFRAVLPGMRQRNWGRLVSTSSMGAFTGGVRLSHYCAAKAGIAGLTISMASELARTGITVNAVAPGVIDTPMVQESPPRWVERMTKSIPMRRLGKPEDIAYAVALPSPELAPVINATFPFNRMSAPFHV
ncbi:MAG: SDR family oxidoreductase [Deltaproteobacteria bacterium]|nr:SDR family oxidoreductase [Deltaproteobacteria bacterium]